VSHRYGGVKTGTDAKTAVKLAKARIDEFAGFRGFPAVFASIDVLLFGLSV